MSWFDVDHKGLAKLLERKGKQFAIFELVQNAWDENCSRVSVSLARRSGTPYVELRVEDDNPEGFRDLGHAFTLFAESSKKHDPAKRGRFNLGEKLVIALCQEAKIVTTTGSVVFGREGRRRGRERSGAGSVFSGVLRMTEAEMAECSAAMRCLIAPVGVQTTFNGIALEERQALKEFTATLPTEVAGEDGLLRRTQRKATVRIYAALEGETPSLYEMGIPVVSTGDRWHVNVEQKLPLNMDRDNVTPEYLSKIRALTLDQMADAISQEDATSVWVSDALQSHGEDVGTAAINRVAGLRFGAKRVVFDASDPEANGRAAAQGYTVVHGSQLSAAEWEAMKRVGAILPAGRVTPSPKPFSPGGTPLRMVAREKWTADMERVCAYAQELGRRLLGAEIAVQVANDVGWFPAATYGGRGLIFNLGRLGHKWFGAPLETINRLLIHEFGHEYSGNHLSSEYHDALCNLGAKLGRLALEDPALFAEFTPRLDPKRTPAPRAPRRN